jgi:spermidine synthase
MNIKNWFSSGEKLEMSGGRNASVTVVVAICSIVYELVYAEALRATFGNQVARYAITIGLYLLCLGIGAIFYSKIKGIGSAKAFLSVELMLSILGPLGFFFIIWISSVSYFNLNDPVDYQIALALAHIPIVVVGILSGMELPLLADMNQDESGFSKTLGWDYIGSLMGTIGYALLIYPKYGLTVAAIATGALNLIAAIAFIWMFQKQSPKLIVVAVTASLMAYIAIAVQVDKIDDSVRKIYYSKYINDAYSDAGGNIYYHADITEHYKTKYQNVIFYDLYTAGKKEVDKCMNLDRHVQMCDSWVELYHEGLVDVPMALIDKPEPEVLLIGGGDWIPVRKLIPYNARIDHVDIDREFTEITKKQPLIASIHQDSYKYEKLNTIYTDGFAYVRESKKKYDLIVVDLPGLLTDKLLHLYSEEFFYFLRQGLNEDGYLVNWTYSPTRHKEHRDILLTTIKNAGFKDIIDYQVFDEMGAGGEFFYVLRSEKNSEESDRYGKSLKSLLVNAPDNIDYAWESLDKYEARSNSIFHPNMDMIVKKALLL